MTLREMSVGAARRARSRTCRSTIARRAASKAIAGYLINRSRRSSLAVKARPDDTANRGWGVVIDTIEIQQVRVQSEHVFADLQAPFRASRSPVSR